MHSPGLRFANNYFHPFPLSVVIKDVYRIEQNSWYFEQKFPIRDALPGYIC